MAFSQYLADKILTWIKGTTFPTALSTVYISLHSGDPGTAGANNNVQLTITGSANRTSVATSTFSTVGAATGGGFQVTNNSSVQITTNAAGSATVTYFGVWDAVTGGNFLASGQLTTSVDVVGGDTVQFNAGALAIRLV
jgi:type 1 fimbria pilin